MKRINHTLCAVLLPLLIGLCLGGSSWAEAPRSGAVHPTAPGPSAPATLRLALVELGGDIPIPAPFADLLFVELSGREDLHLLERQEVNRIVEEQKLSLMTRGAVDADSAVQAGKILAADALLILELENHSEKPLLRTRLVDARYGLKLFDGSLAQSKNADGYEALARQVAARVARHIRRINVPPDQLLLVGVSSFLSEELSPEWDWLSDEIPTAIEQNLGLYPGVVLLERKAIRPLTEERELTSGLPEALQASAILINGSYRMQDGKDTVSVRVRARRQAVTLAEETFQTPLDTVGSACAQAAKRLLGQLRSSQVGAPMNAGEEAEILAEEARTYLARGEANRAIPAAEAALALVPESLEYMQLVIRSIDRGVVSQRLILETNDPRPLLHYHRRVTYLAYKTMRTCPLPPLFGTDHRWTEEEWQRHVYHVEAFVTVAHVLRPYHNDPRYFDNAPVDIFYAEFCEFFDEARKRYEERPRLLSSLLTQFSGVIRRSASIEEAIRLADELVPLESRAHQAFPHKCRCRLYTIWNFYSAFLNFRESDSQAGEKGLAYLEKLQHSPDPYVRAESLKCGLEYYTKTSPSEENRRQLATAYVKASKEAFRTDPKPVKGLQFDEDPILSEQIQMAFIADLLEFSLAQRKARDNGGWTGGVLWLADYLARNGQAARALELLEQVLAKCDSPKPQGGGGVADAISQLKAAHPELVCDEVPSAHLPSPIPVLRADGIRLLSGERTRFWRFARAGSELVIIYNRSGSAYDYGGIRFDPLAGKVLSIVPPHRIPQKQRDNPKRSTSLTPVATAFGSDIHIGRYGTGIATIRDDGSVTRLHADNGLPIDGTVFLARLEKWLIGVMGDSVERGEALVAVNLETGRIKTVCSSRDDTDADASHHRFLGLVADRRRNIVWFISRGRNFKLGSGPPGDRLFRYDPESDSLEAVHTRELENQLVGCKKTDRGTDGTLRLFGDRLLIRGMYGLCEYNIETGRTRLLSALPCFEKMAQWREPWLHLNPPGFSPVNDGLVYISQGKLLHFQNGERDPSVFPFTAFALCDPEDKSSSEKEGLEISKYVGLRKIPALDLAATKQGLYVLTHEALWLIPGIVAEKEGEGGGI
ncbi:MAG: hypothetical protein RRC34_04120 [Lentisphaeria bacterium]|nr:hypothetical protein [Lentisphaeria bacterium]